MANRTRNQSVAGDARQRLVLAATADVVALDRLAQAFAGGDIAAVILAPGAADEAAYENFCSASVPVVQRHAAAAIVCDDKRIMGRSRADGIFHTSTNKDAGAQASDKQNRPIVGIGGISSRDEAMVAGERNPDFVLFGRLDGDIRPRAHPKNLELAAWWADLIEIPCVVMAGSDVDSVGECAACGADFVAVSAAVWQSADGPAEAVRRANAFLAARSADGQDTEASDAG